MYGSDFYVDKQTLQNTVVEMWDQYAVLNIMRGVGLEPRTLLFTGLSDYAFGRWVLWSPNGVYNLFHGCDSIYHNESHNQKDHWYFPSDAGRFKCLGTELNYYIQGALFRSFDCGYNFSEGFCRSWKDISGHGTLTQNCVYFLVEGFNDIPLIWPRILGTENKHQQDANRLEHNRMKLSIQAARAKDGQR